jgi:methyl-accepting chemotaxis protein
MKKRSTLERQMFTYFGLIAAASLLIMGEFVWAIQTSMTKAQALGHSSVLSNSSLHEAIIIELGALRNKAFIMCLVQAVVTLTVLIMFLRRITGPLQKLIEHSRMISEGDLTRTIEVGRKDEIGLLGDTINELTTNIQEIVAYGLSLESSLRSLLEEPSGRTENRSFSQKQLDEIKNKLSRFRSFLEIFEISSLPRGLTAAGKKK